MKKTKKGWKNYLYIINILFFAFGFLYILFVCLGFVCMTIPFVLLAKDKKKTWCQGNCPRANLFSTLFNRRAKSSRKTPKWLVHGNAKWIVLVYFSLNLFVLVMSTIMVFKGRVSAIENVRFLFAFRLPWNMPNLIDIGAFPSWSVHLSFRLYSMMFTTTVIGLILAWYYKPRTWCTICPVNTVSDLVLSKKVLKGDVLIIS